jgi:hypothetical protein
MAIQGDYIKDYSAIYSYPAQVPNVGSLVYGEMGVPITTGPVGGVALDRAMGAVLGNLFDGRFGTWAIHMREFTPQLGHGDLIFGQAQPGYDPNTTNDPNFNANQAFDLEWGQKFGTTSIGLRLNRSFFKEESDIAGVTTNLEFDPAGVTPNTGRNILGFGGGVAFEMSPTMNLEAALLYENRTFTDDEPGVPIDVEDDGPTTYVFSARAMWQYQPNVMIVPVFKWYSYDLSTVDNIAAVSADNSLKGWQIGAAGNWTLGSNDLFVLGVTFAQNKIEQEAPVFIGSLPGSTEITEVLTPQLFGALETHVNPWLTLRFGANKGVVHSVKSETATDSDKISDSPFAMSLGAGVKVGTLQLDGLMNNAFPHTLGYLTSGVPTVLFTKVSATYAF